MSTSRRRFVSPRLLIALGIGAWACTEFRDTAGASEWTLELAGVPEVAVVGLMQRWDDDGNAVKPVDPKARIEAPGVTVLAQSTGRNRWTVAKLTPGLYDVVIVTRNRVRIEGCSFPPVLEFDPFLRLEQTPPAEALEQVRKHIAASRQYENKVTSLFFAGNDKQIRVFMQLLRDEATSFDADFGRPVATLRHEVWQYTNQYGGWVKEKRTRVFDRVLLARDDLRGWTWVWDPRLGSLDLGKDSLTTRYEWPSPEAKGLRSGER